MAYETGAITGTFTHPDGTAHRGSVRVTPSVPVMRDQAGDVIMSGSMAVELDETGAFTITLPASDDAALDPTGVTYALQARLTGAASQRFTGVFVATDGTIDLADIGSLDPAAPSYQEWVNAAEAAAGEAETAQAAAEAAATTAAGHAAAAAGSAVTAEAAVVAAEAVVADVATAVDEAVEQAIEEHTPGIELGYAERVSTFTTSATGLITTLSITVVGNGRPVDVEFYCPRVWNATTANTYISGRIFRNGVQATDGGVFSPVTSAGPSMYVKHPEPTIAVGVSVTFTVQAFLGSAGSHSFFASGSSKCYLKAMSR